MRELYEHVLRVEVRGRAGGGWVPGADVERWGSTATVVSLVVRGLALGESDERQSRDGGAG